MSSECNGSRGHFSLEQVNLCLQYLTACDQYQGCDVQKQALETLQANTPQQLIHIQLLLHLFLA